MSVELAGSVGQAALGGRHSAPDVDNLALAVHHAGPARHCAQVVCFQLDRRIASASGEHRLNGAAHRGIEQGCRNATMHGTQRIVLVLGRLRREDGNSPDAIALRYSIPLIVLPFCTAAVGSSQLIVRLRSA